jgi:aspartate 1-decarboxylase
MKINGAAARLVHRGDTIIVISYGSHSPDDLEHYAARVVHVGAHNEIINVDEEVATLLGATSATSAANGSAVGGAA